MQLLAIVLYNAAGDRRVVEFKPGALNVVTGSPGRARARCSTSSSSALAAARSQCLSARSRRRSRGTRFFSSCPVAAPSWPGPPALPGAASSQLAMLEIGADLEPLPFEDLETNADADTVRDQLGRAIGIGENAAEPEPDSLRQPLEANLGHAALLCLQRQGRDRQPRTSLPPPGRRTRRDRPGDPGHAPYFLGAVPRDQALQRQRLTNARRDLRRAEEDLARARAADEEVEVSLRAMVREAIVAGLLPDEPIEGRSAMLTALQSTLTAAPPPPDRRRRGRRTPRTSGARAQRAPPRAPGRRRAGRPPRRHGRRRTGLRGRRRPADLAPPEPRPARRCRQAGRLPVCGHDIEGEDADVDELREAAEQLSGQLSPWKPSGRGAGKPSRSCRSRSTPFASSSAPRTTPSRA